MAHWKQRETIFSEQGFQITMPGHWQRRDMGDLHRWFYRSPDKREQITITRLDEVLSDGPDGHAVMDRTALRNRRAIELAFGRVEGVTFTEMEWNEPHEIVPAVGFEGEIVGGRHYFRSLLQFESRVAWALFYESFKISQEEARERGMALLATAGPVWAL